MAKKKKEFIVPKGIKAVVFTKDENGEAVFPNAENIAAIFKKKKKKIRY